MAIVGDKTGWAKLLNPTVVTLIQALVASRQISVYAVLVAHSQCLTNMAQPKIIIGVLNVSDRASAGIYEDIPGKACAELLREWLTSPFELDYKVVPDEQAILETELKRMADEVGCALIVTTGGTGPAVRDVTPEATEAVCDKMLPGFGELMRSASLKFVPTAILSR